MDYVRKVKLRGQNQKLIGEEHSIIEQMQYEDIWANDNYLQFMYERLILLKELLSKKGSIYLHCDWHKSHYLRFLMDEVFGERNFVNEIVWCYTGPTNQKRNYPRKHDTLFFYKNGNEYIFNSDSIRVKYKKSVKSGGKTALTGRASDDRLEEMDRIGKIPEDWWIEEDIPDMGKVHQSQGVGFPTQKPEQLLERIIKASSDENSIVLDCFCGSGTTAVAAENLTRRWIMVDLNKGAIQTTIKRLQGIVKAKDGSLLNNNKSGFIHYKVNDYEITKQHELKKFIIAKYGIQTISYDLYFDGLVQGQLAKIVDLNRPLNRLDIQLIRDEIENNRPDETRNIHVFCNGCEIELVSELDQDRTPINKIVIQDILQDGLITNKPVEAEIDVVRLENEVLVKIINFICPSILARLNIDRTLFNEQIDDFRALIDYVLIDTDYKNNIFNTVHCDVPIKKTDFIRAEYKLRIPHPDSAVAVKIVSMLGEEYLEEFERD